MVNTREFDNLVFEIKKILKSARHNAFYIVNVEMLKAYFEIGRKIVEEEQKGNKRAKYGKYLLEGISKELIKEFGKGFGITALKNMRIFYKTFKGKIGQSVTDEFYKLSWTHYCELIKIKDEHKRSYFQKYAIVENLSVRELKRQIYSLHYERLLLSKDKNSLLEYERKGNVPVSSEELIKDPYILEFLGLEENSSFTETVLESRILDNLQKFLLELGQGFSFVSRQKRFTIDNDNFYIDLLFYNIYLKCYVVIELKTAKFKHGDVGQINFYLNYVKKELNRKEDNAPIGIVLCTEKNKVQVEYSVKGVSNKLFVSKYELCLPKKQMLEKEIEKLL
jgi:predicted nuclease of restriction endonuclease-like (RecB) superfamily